MTEDRLADYYGYLYGYAVRHFGDDTAADLVQECMIAALIHLRRGGEIRYPGTFLVTLLKHRHADMLRERYRNPCEFYGDMATLGLLEEEISDPEAEEESVRREVGRIREMYREVVVRHYMRGQSIEEIARAMGIPRGTVMSRLHMGRQKVKERLMTERYGDYSYAPKDVRIGIWGQTGRDNAPFSLLTSPIEGNLMLAAYEKPQSMEALSASLGIPAAYLEHFTKNLCAGELMGQTPGGLYYTRCFIQTYAESFGDIPAQDALAAEMAHAVWEEIWRTFSPMLEEEEVQAFSDKQKATLFLFLTIQTLYQCIHRANRANTMDDPLPQRPDGGRWLAMLTVLDSPYRPHPYEHSGCVQLSYAQEKGHNDCMLFDWQTPFGDTHWGFPHRLPCVSEPAIMRLIASLCPSVVTAEKEMYVHIPTLVDMHILRREADGRAVPDIPCLSWEIVSRWNQATVDIRERMWGILGDRLTGFMESVKIDVPAHVDGRQMYRHQGALGGYAIAQLKAIVHANLLPWAVEMGKTPLLYLGYKTNH